MRVKKTTDIESIRELAIALLYMDVQKTETPFVVNHPYTDSPHLTLKDGDKFRLCDITQNENDLYAWQQQMRTVLERMTEAHQFIGFITKSYRIAFLKYAKPYLSDEDLGQMLRTTWTTVGSPSHDPNISKAAFVKLFRQAGIQNICDPDECRFVETISSQEGLVIYRGTATDKKDDICGLSWTTDPKIARWFANRYRQHGNLYKARVQRKDILAYFEGGESEVVVNPKGLQDIELMEGAG